MSKSAMLRFVFHFKLGSSSTNMRAEMNPYPKAELTKSLITQDAQWRRQGKKRTLQ